jgi:hypothetical protein
MPAHPSMTPNGWPRPEPPWQVDGYHSSGMYFQQHDGGPVTTAAARMSAGGTIATGAGG